MPTLEAVLGVPRALIYALPTELLARIFVLRKEDEEMEALHDPHGRRRVRFIPCQEVYTRVSAHFRSVALGTPSLWTSVMLNSSTTSDQVSAHCARSSSAPLDINVELCAYWRSDPRTANSVFEMLAVIVAHSHRWRKLAISLGRETVPQWSVVGLLCSCPCPMLEHLALSVDSVDIIDVTIAHTTPATPSIFIHDTTNITFLRLRGMAIHFFRPPMGPLTVLHLDQTNAVPIAYTTFKELVTASANLAHLSVYGDMIPDGDWPVPPSVAMHLPALQSLRIRGNDGLVFAGIIMNIDAPLLHSLILKDMQDSDLDRDWQHPFSKTLPKLKELTFCDFDLSEKAYRSLFRMFPCIEEFHCFSSTIGTSKLFKSLCEGEGSYPTAPSHQPWAQLHTLTVGFDDRDDSFLVQDLLDDRRMLGSPLTEIRFATLEDGSSVHAWLADVEADNEMGGAVVTTTNGIEDWPPSETKHCLDYYDTLFD